MKHSVIPALVGVLHIWHLPSIPKYPKGQLSKQAPSGLMNYEAAHDKQLNDVQV